MSKHRIMNFRKRSIAFAVLGLFLVGDRLLKWLAAAKPGQSKELIPRVFDFGFYPNSKLLFWVDLPPLLAFGVVLAALVLLFIFMVEQKPQDLQPFYFIFGGALSNFYDRGTQGAVIDFFHILNLSTINFADILILLGLVQLIAPIIKSNKYHSSFFK